MKLSQLFEQKLKEPNEAIKEFINVVNSGFSNNFKFMIDNDCLLYRGVDKKHHDTQTHVLQIDKFGKAFFAFGVSETRERRSKTLSNIANLHQSTSDIWAKFPKRNKSIFTSTSADHAGEFGELAIIIPADDISNFGALDNDWNYANLNRSNEIPKFTGALSRGIMDIIEIISSILINQLSIDNGNPLSYVVKQDSSNAKYFADVKECANIIKKFNESSQYDWEMGLTVSDIKTLDQATELFKLAKLIKPYVNSFGKLSERSYRLAMAFNRSFAFLKLNTLNTAEEVYGLKIDPKKMRAKNFKSIKDLKKLKQSVDSDMLEVWFEGKYLIIYMSNNSNMKGRLKAIRKYLN